MMTRLFCIYCGAPAARGTDYRDSGTPDYRGREYQCGLPAGSPVDACGLTFRVHTAGPCLPVGVDDVCMVVGDGTFCRPASTPAGPVPNF